MRHFMMRMVTAIAVVLWLAGAAAAQTTRPGNDNPAPLAWQQAIASFAAAAASHDADALRAVVNGNCVVHRFLSGRDHDLEPLIEFTASPILLGAHAYSGVSPIVANDIAADVETSQTVPDDAKKWLDLGDGIAGAVAVKWIGQSLGADETTPVGLLVLWTSSADRDVRHRLVFILIKGQQTGQQFNITEVVYGDPL
jgi:hypothetical protein